MGGSLRWGIGVSRALKRAWVTGIPRRHSAAAERCGREHHDHHGGSNPADRRAVDPSGAGARSGHERAAEAGWRIVSGGDPGARVYQFERADRLCHQRQMGGGFIRDQSESERARESPFPAIQRLVLGTLTARF